MVSQSIRGMMEKIRSEVHIPLNLVRSLFVYKFTRTMEEKIRVKKLRPDKPDLIITQQTKEKNKAKNWSFWRSANWG